MALTGLQALCEDHLGLFLPSPDALTQKSLLSLEIQHVCFSPEDQSSRCLREFS